MSIPKSVNTTSVSTMSDWLIGKVDMTKDLTQDYKLSGDSVGESEGVYPSGLVVKLDESTKTATPFSGSVTSDMVLGILLNRIEGLGATETSSDNVPIVYRNVNLQKSALVLRTESDRDDVASHFEKNQNCGINTVA